MLHLYFKNLVSSTSSIGYCYPSGAFTFKVLGSENKYILYELIVTKNVGKHSFNIFKDIEVIMSPKTAIYSIYLFIYFLIIYFGNY